MCREVNLAIGDIVGADRGVLPLGRHSLMNGLGLRGSPKVSDEVFEDFAHALIAMFRQQGRLGSWGRDEGAAALRAGRSYTRAKHDGTR